MLFNEAKCKCLYIGHRNQHNVYTKSMRNHDMKSFWKDVSSTYSRKVPLATTVNGASDPSTICDMWKNQFKTLLNCVTTDTHKCATIDALSTIYDDSYINVTPDMVSVAIGKLKCGKACGSDRLFAEHYIHADSRLAVLLSTFFTSALTHGHVPDAFMQSILVHVIKNKSGDSNDVNNYRPIALVTIASKNFETILLDVMEPFIVTCDNQFGFKKKHSTEHCIYALKNVISYYNWFGSPVYTCFLDASKAFDRVEHWSLFKKLIDRNVPLVVVRLLVHWYRQQTLCVKWGRNTSSFFTVTNGVRQGGILSPFLFTLYVDDLSHQLNNSKVGCHINNVCITHLFYADDLCLMAPSPVGLQLLIDICAKYGFENDLLFNRSKSVCMVVKPRGRNVSTPLMFLNGDALEYVDSVKYLGVVLSQDMKDDADMSRHLRSFYARSNVIFRKFHHCSASIKVNLIKTYYAPYCSQLWVNHTKCSYNKLRVAYNNAYRRVLGYVKSDSASNMFVNNQVENFDAHNRHLIYSLRSRILNCENSIVVCLNDCFYIRGRYMWT